MTTQNTSTASPGVYCVGDEGLDFKISDATTEITFSKMSYNRSRDSSVGSNRPR